MFLLVQAYVGEDQAQQLQALNQEPAESRAVVNWLLNSSYTTHV